MALPLWPMIFSNQQFRIHLATIVACAFFTKISLALKVLYLPIIACLSKVPVVRV